MMPESMTDQLFPSLSEKATVGIIDKGKRTIRQKTGNEFRQTSRMALWNVSQSHIVDDFPKGEYDR